MPKAHNFADPFSLPCIVITCAHTLSQYNNFKENPHLLFQRAQEKFKMVQATLSLHSGSFHEILCKSKHIHFGAIFYTIVPDTVSEKYNIKISS